MSESNSGLISSDRLAALTGLTDRRHRQLAKEGYFPEPERGQYELAPTLRGLFKFYREVRQKDTGNQAAEKLRKTKEGADKLALENEKTRGRLVEVETVYRHFEGIFVGLRARILASSMTDQEKDETLNDLRRLRGRDLPSINSPQSQREATGEDSEQAVSNTDATAAV